MLTEYYQKHAHKVLTKIVLPVLKRWFGLDTYAMMFREAEVQQAISADITGLCDNE